MKLALLISFLVLPWFPATSAEPFLTAIERRPFLPMDFYGPTDANVYTHQMKLTALVLRQSGWTPDAVLKRMKRVTEIYAQCGLEFVGGELIEATDTNGQVNRLDSSKTDLGPVTQELKNFPSPIFVYHREDVSAKAAFSESDEQGGLHAAFFPFETEKGKSPLGGKGFSLDANLLGHLILSYDLIDLKSPNLMAEDDQYAAGQLTPAQCAQVKRSLLVSDNAQSTPASALKGLRCVSDSKTSPFGLYSHTDHRPIGGDFGSRLACENSLLHSRHGLVCHPGTRNGKRHGLAVYSLNLKAQVGEASDLFEDIDDCWRATRFSRPDRMCNAHQDKFYLWSLANNRPIGTGFAAFTECEKALAEAPQPLTKFEDL